MKTLRIDAGERRKLSVFDVLDSPVRRLILKTLDRGPLNVVALCKVCGKGQQAVSHHLAMLRLRGAVEVRRSGKSNYYSLGDEGRHAVAAIELIEGAEGRAGHEDDEPED